MGRYKPAHRARRKREEEKERLDQVARAEGADQAAEGAGGSSEPGGSSPAGPDSGGGPPTGRDNPGGPTVRINVKPRNTGELPAILRVPSSADRPSPPRTEPSGWVDTSRPDTGGTEARGRPDSEPLGQPAWTPAPLVKRKKRRLRKVAVALAVLLFVGAAGVGGAWYWKNNHPGSPKPSVPAGEAAEQQGSKTAAVVQGQVGPAGPTADWVKAENAKPGSANWHLVNDATNGQIEGYADRVSIPAGQSVNLYVSTTAPTFHVEAYRMGFYQGLGARLVWKSSELTGTKQARATFTPVVNMVEAPWKPSLSVSTDNTWPQGDYLFKLVDSTGHQRYVPLTVRNDQSKAAFLIVNAVTTWQAYNLWGDYDLYQGAVGRGADFYHRSREVSFDRPYLLGSGSGDFLGNEFPFVSMAESLGLDVGYTTSVDVHEDPGLLQRHAAALSMGHDEYYSMAMRQAMIDARDHGVNLAFFGANAIYRHVRFESSPLGADRRVICWKSTGDPLTGINNADVTVDWRDPPNRQPEAPIIGNYYQCNPVKADMVVADASNWLLAGTRLSNGQKLSEVVGAEYDRYSPAAGSPNNLQVIMHSPVTCHGLRDYSDATYYTAPSGAGVFASGTSAWIARLDESCAASGCAGASLVKITQNLLAAFGVGPAGRTHPSTANAVAISEGARPGAPEVVSQGPVPDNGSGAVSGSVSSTTSSASVVPPPITAPYQPPTTRHRFPTTTRR